MSHEIIKSITVRDGKVFLCSASNNVAPRHFKEWHCESLTDVLNESGREGLDLEILRCYVEGGFQRGSNRYTRALKVLEHAPEYKQFHWSNFPKWEEYQHVRDSQEFVDLLKWALKTQLPKQKFVILSVHGSTAYYLQKLNKTCARWVRDKKKASVFSYQDEVEGYIEMFKDTEKWQIIPL